MENLSPISATLPNPNNSGLDRLCTGVGFLFMKEIWKDVKGYEGRYRVSNLGRVISLITENRKTSIFLKLSLKTTGYYQVTLTKNKIQKTYLVHSLVVNAFILNPENKPHVNHIDKNKRNNNTNNLEFVSVRENTSHGNLGRGTSKYIGVSWYKRYKKWVAKIDINNKEISLGYFVNEIDAANAYTDALKKYGIINKYAKRSKKD